MTIALTGAGSLFVRQGHEFGGIADILALTGGPPTARVLSGASIPNRVLTTIQGDYTALPQVINAPSSLITSLASFQGGLSSLINDLSTRAQNTLLSMYNIDVNGVSALAPIAQLIAGTSLQQALAGLITQMAAASASVQAATVAAGSQTSVGSPNGNPTIFLSLKNPQGLLLQLCLPEVLTFVCSQDAQSGNASLGNETLSYVGQTAVANQLSPLWPAGSGASGKLQALSSNQSAGQLAANGNFLSFSNPNVPDNWVVGSGVAGTQILNGTGTTYLAGGGSVQFVGNATAAGIMQPFGTANSASLGAGGTPTVLAPDTVYNGVICYKLSSASPAAGVLEVALIDGSAWPGVVIQNDQTGNNLATVTLSGVADTLWHTLPFSFQTPRILPTTSPQARIRIRLSTALSTGTNVNVSNYIFSQPSPLYLGGPYASVFAGPNALIAGLVPDTFTIAISNSYKTSGSGLLHFYYDRCFGLRQKGLQLGYNASPTVLDTVIA